MRGGFPPVSSSSRNARSSASGGGSGGAPATSGNWTHRISQPGVVWYHGFQSASEVDKFRWTGGYGGGNDPNAVGSAYAANTAWVSSGGPDGMGYLQITRPAGSAGDGTYWLRQFNPLDASSNGRGVSDPADAGAVTVRSFTPTDGGNQSFNWATGWYGHSDYSNANFDGTDYWVQIRLMTDPRRTTAGNTQVGKRIWFSTMPASYTVQELVTYSANFNVSGNGQPNYHNVYQGHNYSPLSDVATTSSGTKIQLGSEIPGICDVYNSSVGGCWAYATDGTWDTLLYHVTPGHAATSDTRFEVWAAHANESTYTKIWDVLYPAYFDTGTNLENGWNALLLAIYQNAETNTEYWHRFAQVIFSRQTIPCPVRTPSWLVGMAVGEYKSIGTNNMVDVATTAGQFAPTGDVTKISKAWNSYSLDRRTSRMYSAANGGHGDWSGNQVLMFDPELDSPVWSEIEPPTSSPGDGYPSGYYYDGKPCSRHSNQGQTVDEANNRLMLFGGSPYLDGRIVTTVDAFDLSTNNYVAAGTYSNVPSANNLPTDVSQATVTHPTTGYSYMIGNWSVSRLDPSTKTWTTLINQNGSLAPYGDHVAACLDTKRNRIVLIGDDGQGTGTFDTPARYYDIAGNSFTNFTLTGTSASAVESAAIPESCLEYVYELDKYFMFTGAAGGTVYQIDPVTWDCSVYATTGASPPAHDSSGGLYRKALYAPRLGGFVYKPSWSGGTYFLRVV